jgi:alpha-D-ribose 1-methylphosphonate 5-triphosphate diphosphatase
VTGLAIQGGRVLVGDTIAEATLDVAGGDIVAVNSGAGEATLSLDARGLLVLPGIVDIHGDAFERQMMPRPGVDFPIDIALADSDRQAIANGITTVFHATTWSWEPGLRSADNATRLIEAIEAMRPRLYADTRFHLRHETYNLDAEGTIAEWLAAGRIDLLAFNDHMSSTVASLDRPQKRARMVERTGLTDDAFEQLVSGVTARAAEVPEAIARIAAAARAANVRMLSHDDETPAQRQAFRAMGVSIAEFPINEETAIDAAAAGDFIVFGAPNVVRGGSHTGWTKAADMIANGLCSVLASDYYYPAPLFAAFRLVADGILPLPKAWALISSAPATAASLIDRGRLAAGQRADVILVDDASPLRPRVVAVIAAGRLVHLTEGHRLTRPATAPRKAFAVA